MTAPKTSIIRTAGTGSGPVFNVGDVVTNYRTFEEHNRQYRVSIDDGTENKMFVIAVYDGNAKTLTVVRTLQSTAGATNYPAWVGASRNLSSIALTIPE